MKKGFSLVELIVVIGIIAVLAASLVGALSGGTDSATSARCLSNMKNLSSACLAYVSQYGVYPLAGDIVTAKISAAKSGGRRQVEYTLHYGWISGKSKGSAPRGGYDPVCVYDEDGGDETSEVRHAFEKGTIWSYVSGNRSTYLCPLHASTKPEGLVPNWSYVMNGDFQWDHNSRERISLRGLSSGSMQDKGQYADRKLLFAEIPFMGYNTSLPTGGGIETDPILQYSSGGVTARAGEGAKGGGSEEIGVNHWKRGKKDAYAHVAFADGHVEKIRIPVTGGKPDTTQLRQLTSWLCTGYDISFDGSKYSEVTR